VGERKERGRVEWDEGELERVDRLEVLRSGESQSGGEKGGCDNEPTTSTALEAEAEYKWPFQSRKNS